MARIDTQTLLDLYERTNSICFFDIEATTLTADYGSIVCISVKPFSGKPETLLVRRPGRDGKICREARDILNSYHCWVTYYGKGFDVKMLNTRLLLAKQPILEKKHHLDLYYLNRGNLALSRRSQAHIMNFLGQKEQKMSVSPNVWGSDIPDWKPKTQRALKLRCESDVIGLQELYTNVRHIVRDLKS